MSARPSQPRRSGSNRLHGGTGSRYILRARRSLCPGPRRPHPRRGPCHVCSAGPARSPPQEEEEEEEAEAGSFSSGPSPFCSAGPVPSPCGQPPALSCEDGPASPGCLESSLTGVSDSPALASLRPAVAPGGAPCPIRALCPAGSVLSPCQYFYVLKVRACSPAPSPVCSAGPVLNPYRHLVRLVHIRRGVRNHLLPQEHSGPLGPSSLESSPADGHCSGRDASSEGCRCAQLRRPCYLSPVGSRAWTSDWPADGWTDGRTDGHFCHD